MKRTKLKNGGKPRRKAFLGADGAVMAAATLTAAAMNTAATALAAKQQSEAVMDGATKQAEMIKAQTENNNNLQKESLAFTRQQNRENRQQQQNIQTTLQMLAGQQNMNDINNANKVAVKYGGKPKHRSMKSQPFYGGAVNTKFKVTDGGGVIPINVTPDGYGLYELYGNDHEHYHKSPSGKYKTGVGIKFNDGSVVEGEGNQNSNQGELLYVTPDDAMFISKHSIDGFNPTKAVNAGLHPIEAFNIQEQLKYIKGLNDDGSKTRHKSIKRTNGGYNHIINQANITQSPFNSIAPVSAGVAYLLNSSPVKGNSQPIIARNGARVKLKEGGRSKGFLGLGNYSGAGYNALGNLLGAGVNVFGNMSAANKLADAYSQAGSILSDAYSNMKGIDLSEVSREDYAAPHTLAVVRSADTNINPQLERIRRNAAYERNEINRNTLSSAARQQRLASINDRMIQRAGEQYALKHNQDETIRQGNAERITQTAQANADRDVTARQNWAKDRLSLMQYNNNIENAKLAGMGQAQADAITQAAGAKAVGLQSSMQAIGSGITSSAQGFADTYNGLRAERAARENILIGADTENVVNYLSRNTDVSGNFEQAKRYYKQLLAQGDEKSLKYAEGLNAAYGGKLA